MDTLLPNYQCYHLYQKHVNTLPSTVSARVALPWRKGNLTSTVTQPQQVLANVLTGREFPRIKLPHISNQEITFIVAVIKLSAWASGFLKCVFTHVICCINIVCCHNLLTNVLWMQRVHVSPVLSTCHRYFVPFGLCVWHWELNTSLFHFT